MAACPLWQRLQPVLGKPEITTALDSFYHRAWIPLLIAAFVGPRSATIAATGDSFFMRLAVLGRGERHGLALASAGPPYYDFVSQGAPSVLGPLVVPPIGRRSLAVALGARRGCPLVRVPDRVEAFGFGVSAMPSVHVAAAVLMSFLGFAFSRWLGVLLSIFAVCTFVASVELGWHYALDGYVGALIACAIWWLAGQVARGTRAA